MWIFNSFKQCWRYLRSLFWRKPMDRGVFADIEETHGHEEKLRQESMALVAADPELSRRLEMVQKAMALIFGYTIEYTSRSEDEATMQLLGIRLFNAAASGMKLALSGYYQTAFHQGSRHHGDRIPARLFSDLAGAASGVEAVGQEDT